MFLVFFCKNAQIPPKKRGGKCRKPKKRRLPVISCEEAMHFCRKPSKCENGMGNLNVLRKFLPLFAQNNLNYFLFDVLYLCCDSLPESRYKDGGPRPKTQPVYAGTARPLKRKDAGPEGPGRQDGQGPVGSFLHLHPGVRNGTRHRQAGKPRMAQTVCGITISSTNPAPEGVQHEQRITGYA